MGSGSSSSSPTKEQLVIEVAQQQQEEEDAPSPLVLSSPRASPSCAPRALPMAQTPVSKEDKEAFKHYCPICFVYYTGVFVSECCSHNICELCYDEYVERKRATQPICCPQCASTSFTVRYTNPDDIESRNYRNDELDSVAKTLRGNASPLKIGASLEEQVSEQTQPTHRQFS